MIHNKEFSKVQIFDRNLVRRRRERASGNFHDHDFLFRWSKDQLSERLNDINRTFPLSLQTGTRATFIKNEHKKLGEIITADLVIKNDLTNYIQTDIELLPFKNSCFDLVLSNLDLHCVNDLPGTFLQIRKSLKNDGMFLASMLGGETLYELRNVMMETEIELLGGASPHVFPFADKKQVGDLLMRTGYALPVVDSDIITVTYENMYQLLYDIRGMGEGNSIIARNKSPLPREYFTKADKLYKDKFSQNDGRIVASFEIIFMAGWAPHESQQKPLKRGSAKYRLADILEN